MKEARGLEGVDVGHGKVGVRGGWTMGRRDNGRHLCCRRERNTTAIGSKQPESVSNEDLSPRP